MLRKQTRDPIQPLEINPQVPRDLNDFCMRLLRRDADTNRRAGKSLRALGVPRSSANTLPSKSARVVYWPRAADRRIAMMPFARLAKAKLS